MSRFRRFMGSLLVLSALVCLFASAAPVAAYSIFGSGNQGNPGVVPPGSRAFGKTYGEWSAAWWQWAFSVPWSSNPWNDQTGQFAANGQSGNVWFLAGTVCVTSSCSFVTTERTITIPTGTALFFPVLNSECSTLEGNGTTEAELRACAVSGGDGATLIECDIDGVQVQNLNSTSTAYRVQSPLFNYSLPDANDNVLSYFYGTSYPANVPEPSVGDGYYIMLNPLPAGQHTIHFTGTTPWFGLDVTYHITVDGGKKEKGTNSTSPSVPTTWGNLKALYR